MQIQGHPEFHNKSLSKKKNEKKRRNEEEKESEQKEEREDTVHVCVSTGALYWNIPRPIFSMESLNILSIMAINTW